MHYRLQSVDELRACLCRIPDGIRVEVDRGLAMSTETVADLRLLSSLPPGLILSREAGAGLMIHRPAAGQALIGLTAISAFTSCLGRSAVEDKRAARMSPPGSSSREETMAKALRLDRGVRDYLLRALRRR
jgi:hypothetical protein